MILKNNVGGGNFTDAHGVALNKTNDTIYITRQAEKFIFQNRYCFEWLYGSYLELELFQIKHHHSTLMIHFHQMAVNIL